MTDHDEKRLHCEDEFDLTEYKKRFRKIWVEEKRKRREKKHIVRLLFCSALFFLLAVFFLAHRIFNYYEEINKNKFIHEKALAIINDAPEPAETAGSNKEQPDTGEEDTEIKSEEPKKMLEKIEKLREVFSNEDIVGYLSIDGTAVDYPVAQSSDNEFYLGRDLNGESSAAGSLFMDYECDVYDLSRNTVIYGHNMRNGSMFHNLRYFQDPDYWREHPFISLTTIYEETEWEIFAAYKTSTDFYYIQVIFPDDASFAALLSEMKQKSAYDTGVEVGADDRILTLSTCASSASDLRWVINAKRVK